MQDIYNSAKTYYYGERCSL